MNRITKFDYRKLRDAINECVKAGQFDGNIVTSKSEMCAVLADILGCESDTVRKWTYDGSNGPKDPTYVNALEKTLGVSLRFNEAEIGEMEIEAARRSYSEYAKQSVKAVGELLIGYADSWEWDEEDRYIEMYEQLHLYRPSTPVRTYAKVEKFVRKYFEPVVYAHEKVCPDGQFETYLKYIKEVTEKLYAFVDDELNPIVVC